jgi:uncharacterized protein YndB with AHSA1/START domain
MPNIVHRVEAHGSAETAFKCLSTIDGLASWWTQQTTGDSRPGGVIKFRFGDRGGFEMKVVELDPNKRVQWQVISGPDEWVGTKLSFELKQEGDATAVFFQHRDWKEQSEFMHHCSTKWAMFLISLKSVIETGKGAAYPNDLHITVTAD